ncbi:hypothetical protein J6590_013628 [Homalodisca vitripennis]|nr:hypothetical protein J6590_013628 [Homalodisca vitripennis]
MRQLHTVVKARIANELENIHNTNENISRNQSQPVAEPAWPIAFPASERSQSLENPTPGISRLIAGIGQWQILAFEFSTPLEILTFRNVSLLGLKAHCSFSQILTSGISQFLEYVNLQDFSASDVLQRERESGSEGGPTTSRLIAEKIC